MDSEGSIIGCQGNLKLYYFQIRMKAFLFGMLKNQREIAESYLLKIILKMQKALLPVGMSNFNQKNTKITTNSALAKTGQKTFFRSKGSFQHLY